MQRHFTDSDELCRYVAELSGGVALLSFSLGKDSVAAWLQMRRHFSRIVPFYMYIVPGLSFVEAGMAYYEQFFGCRIVQVPHPSLYRLLNNLVFQAPENCATVEAADLVEPSYDDQARVVARDQGLPPGTFTAHGTRAVDSMMRRASLKRWGSLNPKRRTFLPVFDWRKARLVDEFRAAGVRLSADYSMFGRSFDGIDYRFLQPIRERFPEDYRRILEWFPLADLEIRRREWREKYHGRAERRATEPQSHRAE